MGGTTCCFLSQFLLLSLYPWQSSLGSRSVVVRRVSQDRLLQQHSAVCLSTLAQTRFRRPLVFGVELYRHSGLSSSFLGRTDRIQDVAERILVLVDFLVFPRFPYTGMP